MLKDVIHNDSKHVPARPVVEIPMGEKFMDVVAMDLKHWREWRKIHGSYI